MATEVRIGGQVGSYRLRSLLGRGGMGVVYLAEHVQLGRKVALKVLPPELAADEGFRRRFIRESRLASLIDHPNIIPIYDANETDGVLFIAMRYVEGQDLDSILRAEGTLEPVRTVSVLAQLASALDAAHAEGLIHRDVKPANVLVERREQGIAREHAYLSDFGLTRQASSQTALTGSGQILGTVAYLAPEAFEGKAVDARADEYSLACVAYECLTGKRPFERPYEIAVLWAHLQAERPKITEARSGIPARADGVVAKAMAKSPDERYASCGEFVDSLRQALGVEPDAVPRVSFRRKLVPARVRRLARTGVARVVAAIVALALVGGLVTVIRAGSHGIELAAIGNAVAVLDPETGSVRDALRTGDAPTAIAIGGARGWVVHRGDGSIRTLDLQSARISTIGTATRPTAVALGEGSAWVLGGFPTSTVYPFGESNAAKGSPIDLGTNAEDIAAGLGGVWVTDLNNRALLRIDPKSHEIKQIDMSGIPTGVAVGGGAVWVTEDAGARNDLVRLDPKSEQMTRIALRSRANGVAVQGTSVWVANGDDGSVSQVDVATKRVRRTIRVGLDPIDIEASSDAVWVANYEGHSVSRIDSTSGTVSTTPLGLFPTGVAPSDDGVWVTADLEIPKLQSALCPDEIPVDDPTTCYTLTVPERHTDPGGRTIQLWVERIGVPKDVAAAPDPVVVIGQNGAEHSEYGGAQPLPARTHRETINLELRGVGLSTPKLACPEIQGLPLSSYALRLRAGGREEFLDSVKACHRRLIEEGVDLGAYNITEAAEDVEDLRRAVGVPRWNLRALGYSSRVAFEVIRNYPDGVRAAWFDSPEYPQADYFAQAAEAAEQGLQTLAVTCRASSGCKKHFPDVVGTFRNAVRSLNERPATVTLRNALTHGRRVPVVIDGDLLARFVRQDVGTNAGTIPLMPSRIYAASARRFATSPDSLAASAINSVKFCKGYRSHCALPLDYTDGVGLSMLCHDEAPFTNRDALPKAGPFAEVFGRNPYLDACGMWNVGVGASITHTAVRTSIPILIFHGKFDTFYPFSAAATGAKTLQNSFVYDVPGLGYNPLGSDNCVLSIRNTWIDDPARAPDVGCLANMPATVIGGFAVKVTRY